MGPESNTKLQRQIESVVTNEVGYDSTRKKGYLFFTSNEENEIQACALVRGFEDDFELQLHLGKLDSNVNGGRTEDRDYFSLKNMYRDLSDVGLLQYLTYNSAEGLIGLLPSYRQWRKKADWELAEYKGRAPGKLRLSDWCCVESLLLDIQKRGAVALFQGQRRYSPENCAYISDYLEGKGLHSHPRGKNTGSMEWFNPKDILEGKAREY